MLSHSYCISKSVMVDKNQNSIRVKVMCLITDGKRVLAGKGRDNVKNEDFSRVLGGSLNFGETVRDGVLREIREELNYEVENLKLVDVVENIFIYEGKKGHQITFLFKGYVREPRLCEPAIVHIVEDTYEFYAEWISIEDILNKKVRLYPEYDYSKIQWHN